MFFVGRVGLISTTPLRAERRLGEIMREQKETVGFAKGGWPRLVRCSSCSRSGRPLRGCRHIAVGSAVGWDQRAVLPIPIVGGLGKIRAEGRSICRRDVGTRKSVFRELLKPLLTDGFVDCEAPSPPRQISLLLIET